MVTRDYYANRLSPPRHPSTNPLIHKVTHPPSPPAGQSHPTSDFRIILRAHNDVCENIRPRTHLPIKNHVLHFEITLPTLDVRNEFARERNFTPTRQNSQRQQKQQLIMSILRSKLSQQRPLMSMIWISKGLTRTHRRNYGLPSPGSRILH